MCQYIIRPCTDGKRFSFGICGRFTAAELFSFTLSVSIVCVWVLTGHWLLMDGASIKFYWILFHNLCILIYILAMGMGLCVAFIAFVRLPSLKVSTLLLTGLLIYDVFGYSSHRIYSAQMWWSRWPHVPPRIPLALSHANWIWAALCGIHPSWICRANWFFPAYTIRDISRCLVWVMLLCPVCCSALYCVTMLIKRHRALHRIQRFHRQEVLALGWHIFIVPYWGECNITVASGK